MLSPPSTTFCQDGDRAQRHRSRQQAMKGTTAVGLDETETLAGELAYVVDDTSWHPVRVLRPAKIFLVGRHSL